MESVKLKKDLYWESVRIESARFPDQVATDQDSVLDDVWSFNLKISGADKSAVWNGAAEKCRVELEKIGLVELSREDLTRLPVIYTIPFKIRLMEGQSLLVFRPRDQAAFEKLVRSVEILGDRDIGRMSYFMRGLLVILDGSVQMDNDFGTVGFRISNHPFGQMVTGPDTRPTNEGLPLEANERVTKELAAKILATIQG